MYVADLLLSDFRAVASARVEFVHPDQADAARLELPNINVLVGQNGGGKSTILKGIAAAVFADQVEDLTGGSVHEWPRYDSTGQCSVRAVIVEHYADRRPPDHPRMVSGVETTGNQRRVGLTIPRAPGPSLVVETSDQSPFADTSYSIGFLAAYGPTRRTEALGADEEISAAPRDRVASLFDQAAALVPLEAWLPELDEERLNACVATLQGLLPPEVTFEPTRADGEYQFVQRGVAVPRRALSDGMQSYLGWVTDLLYRLTQATEGGNPTELPGTVLVDEVDQRMHPRWQQTLLTTLSRGLPRVQFICAAHSPLVAGVERGAQQAHLTGGPQRVTPLRGTRPLCMPETRSGAR